MVVYAVTSFDEVDASFFDGEVLVEYGVAVAVVVVLEPADFCVVSAPAGQAVEFIANGTRGGLVMKRPRARSILDRSMVNNGETKGKACSVRRTLNFLFGSQIHTRDRKTIPAK